MIFNGFSGFQYSLQKYIQTVAERLDRIKDSILVGMTKMTSLTEQIILDRKIEELDMDRIADRLHIDVLESRINAGDDDLQVG